MKWSLRLVRVAGTDIYVHASFVLVVAYVLWSAWPDGLSQLALSSAWLVTVFTCVTLHELGHSITANLCGVPVRSIVLWPLGGFAILSRQPEKPLHNLLIAAAGPLVNLVLAVFSWLAFQSLPPALLVSSGAAAPLSIPLLPSVAAILLALLVINGVLALFNLIPAYPLDGGRIVLALLTMLLGSARAGPVVARISLLSGAAIIALGFVLGDVIIVGIGGVTIIMSSLLAEPVRAWAERTRCYLFDRGSFYLQQENYGQAIAQYTRRIRRRPDARAYYNRGWACIQQKDYEQALHDFDQSLLLDPADSSALVGRGLMHYYCTGDTQQAAADFRRAIALNPAEVAAYNNLGLICLAEGDIEQTITECNKAITLAPDFVSAYANRAKAFHAHRRYERVIADCDTTLLHLPDVTDCYFLRGSAAFALGDYDSALTECYLTARRALDVALFDADWHACLKDNLGWACVYYGHMLVLRPGDALSYRGRGDAYRVNGQLEQAIADYDEALRLRPTLAEAYLGRAYARVKQAALTQAASDFQAAQRYATMPRLRYQADIMLRVLTATETGPA